MLAISSSTPGRAEPTPLRDDAGVAHELLASLLFVHAGIAPSTLLLMRRSVVQNLLVKHADLATQR